MLLINLKFNVFSYVFRRLSVVYSAQFQEIKMDEINKVVLDFAGDFAVKVTGTC